MTRKSILFCGLSVAALAGAALLAAEPAQAKTDSADEFRRTLSQHYHKLADQERDRGVALLSQHFSDKSLAALESSLVGPDKTDRWPGGGFEQEAGYRSLERMLRSQATNEVPEMAAAAQVRFDCWIARDGIGDARGAALCEKEFNSAMSHISSKYWDALTTPVAESELPGWMSKQETQLADAAASAQPEENQTAQAAQTAQTAQAAQTAQPAPTPALQALLAEQEEVDANRLHKAQLDGIQHPQHQMLHQARADGDYGHYHGADQHTPIMNAPANYWYAQEGQTLREVLDEWADEAGWQVRWVSPYEYYLEANASFTGDFEDALEEILLAFSHASPPLVGTIYENRVAVIEALGDHTY